jgi:hypothetical protein
MEGAFQAGPGRGDCLISIDLGIRVASSELLRRRRQAWAPVRHFRWPVSFGLRHQAPDR